MSCHLQDATVDECGVCGGLSDSCAILVQAQLQLTPATLQVCCPVPATLHLISRWQSVPAKQPCFGRCTDAHAVPATLHLISPRHSLPAEQACFRCCTDAHAKLPQQ